MRIPFKNKNKNHVMLEHRIQIPETMQTRRQCYQSNTTACDGQVAYWCSTGLQVPG
jgi:hypothetical protein